MSNIIYTRNNYQANAEFTTQIRESLAGLQSRCLASVIDPAQGRFTDDQEDRNEHIAQWKHAKHVDADPAVFCYERIVKQGDSFYCVKCDAVMRIVQ